MARPANRVAVRPSFRWSVPCSRPRKAAGAGEGFPAHEYGWSSCRPRLRELRDDARRREAPSAPAGRPNPLRVRFPPDGTGWEPAAERDALRMVRRGMMRIDLQERLE